MSKRANWKKFGHDLLMFGEPAMLTISGCLIILIQVFVQFLKALWQVVAGIGSLILLILTDLWSVLRGKRPVALEATRKTVEDKRNKMKAARAAQS